MTLKHLMPEGFPPPRIPYSPGVRAGNTIYVSGILALDEAGGINGVGDIRAQARQVIESIKAIVEAGGGTLADVAFNAIFLRDLADYAAFNEVYSEYFGERPPARYCIEARLVPPQALGEISAIAHVAA